MLGSKYNLPAGNLQAFYVDVSYGASANIQVSLYSDAAGSPGNLLYSSGIAATSPGWTEIPASYTVPATGEYWMALQVSAINPFIKYEFMAGAGASLNTGGFGIWPADWTGYSAITAKWAIRALVCSQGTATVSPTITETYTITETFTRTLTETGTATFTRTYTLSSTPTFTGTRTPTETGTATFTHTGTSTQTPSGTETFTPTYTGTPSFTRTATETATYTFTLTWSETPTANSHGFCY
jgi:hypothetical protein